jgi:glycosyltransferase involved in cell wall biosynthesis
MPKVSIIVPIYNVEKYLLRCINSILNQTLRDIEIILVDDESPDSCPQICDYYEQQDNRVKVIHKQNEGLGFARNSGLDIATGDYVAFIDSDDFVDIRMYEDLYHYAEEHACEAVFCGYNIYKTEGYIRHCQEYKKSTLYNSSEEAKQILLDMVGSQPSYKSDVKLLMSVWRAIYSHKIIKENKLRFVSERQYIAEDIIFHFDFLPKCSCVGFIPQTYYNYCDNGVSLTRSYRPDRFDKEIYLYHAMNAKLSAIFKKKQYLLQLDRYLLLKIRGCIMQQVIFMDNLTYNCVIEKIKEICDKPEVKNMVNHYPYHLLPFKHKCFFLFLKYKLYALIIVLFKFAK